MGPTHYAPASRKWCLKQPSKAQLRGHNTLMQQSFREIGTMNASVQGSRGEAPRTRGRRHQAVRNGRCVPSPANWRRGGECHELPGRVRARTRLKTNLVRFSAVYIGAPTSSFYDLYSISMIYCSTPRGTRSSSVVTLSRPPTSSLKSPIAHFAMHHLISGISFLSRSDSLA